VDAVSRAGHCEFKTAVWGFADPGSIEDIVRIEPQINGGAFGWRSLSTGWGAPDPSCTTIREIGLQQYSAARRPFTREATGLPMYSCQSFRRKTLTHPRTRRPCCRATRALPEIARNLRLPCIGWASILSWWTQRA